MSRCLACFLASFVVACGGAVGAGRATPDPIDACATERSASTDASAALETCRHEAAGAPGWRHQARYDRALEEVRAVAVLAARGPVPPEGAQGAADAYWALLDDVSPELTNHVSLDRAENAAESLLRDREGDTAAAAAVEAEAALAALRVALVPEEPPDPCAAAQTASDRAAGAVVECDGRASP